MSNPDQIDQLNQKLENVQLDPNAAAALDPEKEAKRLAKLEAKKKAQEEKMAKFAAKKAAQVAKQSAVNYQFNLLLKFLLTLIQGSQ
jgi:Mg2+/citrate symporter